MSDQYGMPTNDDCVLAIGDRNVLVQLTLVMYVSSFGVRKRSTHKILYLERTSGFVSKRYTFLVMRRLWVESCLFIFRSGFARMRKPVALQDSIGTGPS